MKRNACQKCVFAVDDDKPHCGLRGFRSNFNVEYCSAENDTVPNGYELQEDGYFSWVDKKKEYPKTYEECYEILDVCSGETLQYGDLTLSNDYEFNLYMLLENFRKLRICRDAYWKIAGEEIGLGKPWEPDWNDTYVKYCLERDFDAIDKTVSNHKGRTFAFPTEELRDAFYENFKTEIESCKELL